MLLVMWGIVLTHPVTLAQTSPAIIKLVDWHPQVDVLAVVLDIDGEITTFGPDQIWLYDTQNQPLRQLTTSDDLVLEIIRWSPDGQRLLVLGRTVANGAFRLYMWDTSNVNAPVPITDFEANHPWAYDVTFDSNILIP